MERRAPMLWIVGSCSASCVPRRRGWRVAPANERKHQSLCQLRAAQEWTARRASQLDVMSQEGSA
ncbi:hypothetical protein A2U01_0106587, partial [Trifolium medium]|nr:hypothetical protein [Trifolium medium]